MPIPVLFGMCLGTKRDFGSHVGDWEHMSLFFRGNKEPEVYILNIKVKNSYVTKSLSIGNVCFCS